MRTAKLNWISKILFVILLTSINSFAQTFIFSDDFRSSTTGQTRNIANRGVSSHIITWSVQQGTLSACNLNLESSADNQVWVARYTSTNCTISGTSDYQAFVANFVRVNVTTFTTSVVPVLLTVNYASYVNTPTTTFSGGSITSVGSITNPVTITDGAGAINVICDSGCAGGTTDTDDGTIASGQSTGLNLGLTQVFDGASWRRFTVGTAGTSSSQVLSVQGIASGTPLIVSDGAGALNVIVDSGTIGTVTTITNPVTVTDGAGALNVICDSGCAGGTQYTQDAALTVGSTVGTMAMGRSSATVPTDVSADNDAVMPWYLRSGAQAMQPTFSGSLAVGGSGVNGSGVQRVTIATDDALITSVQLIDNAFAAATPFAVRASDGTNFIVDAAEDAAVATNPVPAGCVNRTASVGLDDGDVGYLRCDVNNYMLVMPGTVATWGLVVEDAAETAGANLMGIGAVVRTSPAGSTSTNNDNGTINVDGNGALWVTMNPNVSGGWSALNATAADGATACTNSAQSVKGSAGTFGGYFINNPNTADSWLHVYNVASGSVTVGTTNPALTFRIPGAASNSGGANLEISLGINFGTAISIACTSTAGGNGAPSNALEADIFYK